MLDILSAYEGILTPEDLNSIYESQRLLTHLHYENHTLALTEILSVREFENNDKADITFNTMHFHIAKVIGLFGIELADDTSDDMPLHAMNKILEGLSALDDPANQDLLDSFAQEELGDYTFGFCELLAEITDTTAGNLVDYIESVDPALIFRIRELGNQTLVELSSFEQSKEIKMNILTLLQDQKSGPLYEYATSLANVPVVKQTLVEALLPSLRELDRNYDLAMSLLGMSILMGVKKDHMIDSAIALREELFFDKSGEIDVIIQNIHGEFMSDE